MSMGHAHDMSDETDVLNAVRRVLDGDVDAFSVIVKTYQNLLAADLSKRLPAQDVQEVAQDTFIRAYRALGSFRHEAPFRVWLMHIARYAALDFWRKKYRRKDMPFADFDEAAMTAMEHSRMAEQAALDHDGERRQQASEWLQAALLQLSPDDRAVITLVELEELSMKDAAHRLGCSPASIRVRAFRARKRLKALLEQTQPGKDENP